MTPALLTAGVPIGEPPARKTSLPSVLVAVMGPYPMERRSVTTETRLLEMIAQTSDFEVNMVYIPDMVPEEHRAAPIKVTINEVTGKPHHTYDLGDGMGMMRQWAVEQTLELGYDHLLLVENDAWVFPETLSRLLTCPADITIPHQSYVTFPPVGRLCWGPQFPIGTSGWQDLHWSCFTTLLIKRSAMEKITPFFKGFEGEGPEYDRWHAAAISVMMDLDTTIDVLKIPTGHKGFTEIPFGVHVRKVEGGIVEACDGVMEEVYTNPLIALWVCSDQKYCGHFLAFNTRFNR